MKKGKLLLLLVAILSFAILAAACDETDGNESPTLQQSGAETVAESIADSNAGSTAESGEVSASETAKDPENGETGVTDTKEEQANETHEMQSYFDLSDNEEVAPLKSISRIDGEVVAIDTQNNLAVVKKVDLDNMSNVIKTLEVYDLLGGEIIRQDSVTYPYGAYLCDQKDIEVSIIYPVIKIQKYSYEVVDSGADPDDRANYTEGDELKKVYDVKYYMACKDGKLVHTTDETACEIYDDYGNGLVCVKMGDEYVWIDKNLEIVRQVKTILATYDYSINPDLFDSEYKGYLYSYDGEKLTVFNRSGVISAQYAVEDTEKENISCVVLDNGNVLIQKLTRVGFYDSCDFVLQGIRCTLDSMIMNPVDGSITDVELDYVVDWLESEYGQENGTPSLKLANGRDNLAIIYKIANGAVSMYADIAVLDNDCNIVYTVKNDTEGVDLSNGITYIGNNKYSALMNKDGQYYDAIFDLDGNFISAYSGSTTDKYIVSNTAIYDYNMELVYDFAAEGFGFVDMFDNKIYLERINFVTGVEEEIYVFDSNAEKPEIFIDGVDFKYALINEYVYIVSDVENETYIVYNNAGEKLLVTYENVSVWGVCADENIVVLSTTFNGEPITYVIK